MPIKYNGRKTITIDQNTKQHFPFKGPPKYTQIGIFWSEKEPSGNPVLDPCHTMVTLPFK
jgi:hypothetical protein